MRAANKGFTSGGAACKLEVLSPAVAFVSG